jgi:hypothetical protein
MTVSSLTLLLFLARIWGSWERVSTLGTAPSGACIYIYSLFINNILHSTVPITFLLQQTPWFSPQHAFKIHSSCTGPRALDSEGRWKRRSCIQSGPLAFFPGTTPHDTHPPREILPPLRSLSRTTKPWRLPRTPSVGAQRRLRHGIPTAKAAWHPGGGGGIQAAAAASWNPSG